MGFNDWRDTSASACSQRVAAHVCNCIGCCRVCGTCRTWSGHTPAYCATLVRQALERDVLLRSQLEPAGVAEGGG